MNMRITDLATIKRVELKNYITNITYNHVKKMN